MTAAESLFYELMWQTEARGRRTPLPWWVQQYFRAWSDAYDTGLFDSREAAFCSNAHYRYWNMVGVKDHRQECLIGQAGEVEPVYDRYALSCFLFDPATREMWFPQYAGDRLRQSWEGGYLPVLVTDWDAPSGHAVQQRTCATTVGVDQKALGVVRFSVRPPAAADRSVWLCVAVSPAGPTGFERHDRARTQQHERWITFLRYAAAERRLEVNQALGPVFGTAPTAFGMYGNGGAANVDHYLAVNPYEALRADAALNGWETATDFAGGYCQGVLAWEVPPGAPFALDVRLPIDDFRGRGDLDTLRAPAAADLERDTLAFWRDRLDARGMQATLPGPVAHLWDLYRTCRATLLTLSDDGEIHPGPTIYDSFWVRDSSIEGVACALAGDHALAARQFGEHYTRPDIFRLGQGTIGPVSAYGFVGGQHEEHDHEWDSNGQALWAFGRFDRIRGPGEAFGARVFTPYVTAAARWLRDNRDANGLLHKGWSAEHLGDKGQPHFWDDLWAVAGLWEAAQLAARLHAPQAGELWGIYDEVRGATEAAMRNVFERQRRAGRREPFIPTGPSDQDFDRLDSVIVGALAYYHPCRLYAGQKLGPDVDRAARTTLELIWTHFARDTGGFRHHSAWRCFGPYLTLQLAHAFLLLGDLDRMQQCLDWAVRAGTARTTAPDGQETQVVLGAWNEQHCYHVESDFASRFGDWWYMGDIPHGWAAAELQLLVRDMLFFEVDEDRDPHVYIAPGIRPEWLAGNGRVGVHDAPTALGATFGYDLAHDDAARTVTIDLRPVAAGGRSPRYVYACRMGTRVESAVVDGVRVSTSDGVVRAPIGARRIVVTYA